MFKFIILTAIIIFSSVQNVFAANCDALSEDIENSLMTIALNETLSDQNSAVRAAARLQEISNLWQRINGTLLLAQIQKCDLDRGPLSFQKYIMDAVNCNAEIRNGNPGSTICDRTNWGKE
ncbi:MAG: hypothetical protein R3D86_08555 [Emcibacteraceae bacterium]